MTACTRLSQRKSYHKGGEGEHEFPALSQDLLTFESFWERESVFFMMRLSVG